ncbi:MAG: 1-(5-phosphoribosyl)-5-[(5-phosphoribosylamino)methylideneamino]imidazole-4-carboxamide isomerase [Gammaproteobacteria bacterium]|nr:1-(5-phosphoribosyl)-5-[(5-phosphoribosylamino)methylideneamino]imidazole-4-carboxamide isomerase [Gammaproteobacteria bacterium]
MLLIPAIDLKDGQCVRLRQGDMNDVTVFSNDPVAMAARWVEAGARRLHIVDLDGAAEGAPVNAEVIHRIASRFPDLPLQVGGGIRNEDTVEVYIQAGVRFVIIGTRAVNEPHFISDLCAEFPTHVIVGLDARDGKVATEGWSKLCRHDAIDMAQHFESDGVEAIIYTDIARDGMLRGVNIEATLQLAEAVNIPVIAAGGIRNLENVKKLAALSGAGIVGAITGRAIYEGTLDFAAGQRAADEVSGQGAFGL